MDFEAYPPWKTTLILSFDSATLIDLDEMAMELPFDGDWGDTRGNDQNDISRDNDGNRLVNSLDALAPVCDPLAFSIFQHGFPDFGNQNPFNFIEPVQEEEMQDIQPTSLDITLPTSSSGQRQYNSNPPTEQVETLQAQSQHGIDAMSSSCSVILQVDSQVPTKEVDKLIQFHVNNSDIAGQISRSQTAVALIDKKR